MLVILDTQWSKGEMLDRCVMPYRAGISSARPTRKINAALSGPGTSIQYVGTPSISSWWMEWNDADTASPSKVEGRLTGRGSGQSTLQAFEPSTHPGIYSA